MKNLKYRKTTIKKHRGGKDLKNQQMGLEKNNENMNFEGLDLSVFYKVGGIIAKLISSGIVFGIEEILGLLSSQAPKPLSKDNIHKAIQILNDKLRSIDEFLQSPEGQELLARLKDQLMKLSDEFVKLTKGPLKNAFDAFSEIISENLEKLSKKGVKFSKNFVRIVPGIGDAFIVAENLGTAATAGTQAFQGSMQSFSTLITLLNSSGKGVSKITNLIKEINDTLKPINDLLTSAPRMAIKQIAGNIEIDELLKGGAKEIGKNLDKLANTFIGQMHLYHIPK